jgi:L-asparaginase
VEVQDELSLDPGRTARDGGGRPAGPRARLVLLATGGTIAGTAARRTDARYKSGSLSVDELLAAVPQVAELAEVCGEQLAQIGSQDMDDAIWLAMAQRIDALLAQPELAGVVVTHGTDTLEETSYFLNLTVRSQKPVVMTAAMRPATALSADGPLNLYNAVAVATDPAACARGVLIVAEDEIHAAREVVKTNTTETVTFRSPNSGRIGLVHYGAARFLSATLRRHTRESEFRVAGLSALPRVDVLYAHAGMSADLADAAVERGARGLVVAGVGNGNMSAATRRALERAVLAGIAVVRASRVGSGVVLRNAEIDDDQSGFAVADDLSPAKARVLLKLLLAAGTPRDRLQDAFYAY